MSNSNNNHLTSPRHTAAQRRRRGMAWAAALILACAIILPSASYLLPGSQSHAQVVEDQNLRANFWRAVRYGEAGYSAVSGPESGVFINSGGQDWRVSRSDTLKPGGWAIIIALLGIGLFYLIRGKIRLDKPRSGYVVPRWSLWERIMHWWTAAGFVLLAISGLSLLFGRAVLIPLFGAEGFARWASLSINVHNFVGPLFTVGVFAMLLFWVRNNLPNRTDIDWFKQGGGIVGDAHPSAGKANGGEKLWFWIVIFVGLLAVCGTGLALMGWLVQLGVVENTRAAMQDMHQIHVIAALIWIVVFFGHVYIGTIGTEGALEGMTRGKVSVEWAKQHHDQWYEQVKDQQQVDDAPASSATGNAQATHT